MNYTNRKPFAPNEQKPVGRFRPQLAFYKANAKGTGSACKFELHPAHDDVDGSIFASFANQLTVGDRRGPNPTYATFDWEKRITVKLDFNDLCKILQVLRGECESIEGNEGLIHMNGDFCTRIKFSHHVDPSSGYLMELFRTRRNSNEDGYGTYMFFSNWEALGLCESIAGSMSVVAFGQPMVIPHAAREQGAEGNAAHERAA